MAKRVFLPSLRGVTPETKQLYVPESASEGKSLTVTGWSSTTNMGSSGHNIYGTEGRADAWDMDAVITEGYERDVWVYRCVELISGHASRLKFQAGRELGTDQEERLANHPLYRVLNKRANPMEKGRAFKKRLSAQLLLSKRGTFVEVIKSRAGTIVRLDLLDPQRCRPIPDMYNGDYVSYFEYTRRDGQVRQIDPSRIRWIREPHPTDPFSGTTPLEAAGMSVELDFLSRLYNVSFIKNDSRPGGVLGVDTDSLSDQEMDRIERKFKPGASHAGELTVIGTGPGGVNYIDSTTKPRDMAYSEAASNSKLEVLSAFGIGESLLGNAAGRTYDNAESELYNFWTQVMPNHLELIADGFDEDLGEEWDPFFDVSSIEVLELPRRRDREEARNEYSVGLRSIDEYRPLAKLRPLDTAQSRALWVSPAKAPIPGQPGDEAALGLGGEQDPGTAGGMPPEGGPNGGPAPAGAVSASDAVTEAQDTAPADEEQQPQGGEAAAAVAEARGPAADADPDGIGEAAQAVADAAAADPTVTESTEAVDAVQEARQRLEGKALEPTPPASVEHEPDESQTTALALGITAVLEAELARQLAVITARLEMPKTRKGTKFWTADGETDTRGGDEPLDAEKITDTQRWEQETLDTVGPVALSGAQQSASDLIAALVAGGVIVGGIGTAAETADFAGKIARTPAALAGLLAANAVREFIDELTETIRVHAAGTSVIGDVVDAVKALYAAKARKIAVHVGTASAYAAVNGARDAAAGALVPMPGSEPTPIIRFWKTVGDDRVRSAHASINGQPRMLDEPFDMHGIPVRFPADPLAPPELRYGCRCHLIYKVDGSARLLTPPPAG